MRILGVDNILFDVFDLDAAIRHYESLGLRLRFKFDPPGIAVFEIGEERPGLLLRKKHEPAGNGRVWLEVRDSQAVAEELGSKSIKTSAPIDTSTGVTIEVTDPWGNVIGFADYSKRPELAR